MKAIGTHILIYCFLGFVTISSLRLYWGEHENNDRNIRNVASLQKENQYFRDQAGNQAVKIQALNLTVSELRKTIPQAIADIKALNISPAQVQNYTQASTTSTARIVTTLKDSVILDTVKVARLDYFDKWYNITGMIKGDTATLDIESKDTLTVINYLGKRSKRFLFIRYGPRWPETVITNKNPYNKITIEKSVFLKR